MQVHFLEEFIKIDPGVFNVAENLFKTDNLWTVHDQVICSMDAVKPMDKRRGWRAVLRSTKDDSGTGQLSLLQWDGIEYVESYECLNCGYKFSGEEGMEMLNHDS